MRIFTIFRTHGIAYAALRRPLLAAPRRGCAWLLFAALCSVFLGGAALQGEEIRAPKVAIVVSRDIRPYIEAVEGMNAVLAESAAGAKVQVFSLEKFRGKGLEALAQSLAGEKFDLFVAVGPEAVKFAREKPGLEKAAWLYSMILNPPAPSGQAGTVCGVPLDIPVQRQLEMIGQGLGSVERLGLLYDPRYNAEVFRRAAAEASPFGLKVVPLRVSSKRDIPAVLKQGWENIDALWLVPDQTVISESIVQYIIKEALFKKIPVIGYNRFFYESGAALAFVLDYEELGRQAGRLAAGMVKGRSCEREAPLFHTWLNLRVIDKLEIAVPEKRPPAIEVGP